MPPAPRSSANGADAAVIQFRLDSMDQTLNQVVIKLEALPLLLRTEFVGKELYESQRGSDRKDVSDLGTAISRNLAEITGRQDKEESRRNLFMYSAVIPLLLSIVSVITALVVHS